MSQQNFFSRNNTGTNRCGNRNMMNVKCTTDLCTQPCDIPINVFGKGANELEFGFVAEVIIPEGYILVNNEYAICLAIETSNLSVVNVTQTYQCCDNLQCTLNKYFAILNGVANYNVNLSNFRAFCPIESVTAVPGTLFSGNGYVYVDQILRTSMTNLVEGVNYTFLPERGEEYITLFDGRSVFRNRDSSEFCNLLNNPEVQKTIRIPYRIKILVGDLVDVD